VKVLSLIIMPHIYTCMQVHKPAMLTVGAWLLFGCCGGCFYTMVLLQLLWQMEGIDGESSCVVWTWQKNLPREPAVY